jgi:hypothetical protein
VVTVTGVHAAWMEGPTQGQGSQKLAVSPHCPRRAALPASARPSRPHGKECPRPRLARARPASVVYRRSLTEARRQRVARMTHQLSGRLPGDVTGDQIAASCGVGGERVGSEA